MDDLRTQAIVSTAIVVIIPVVLAIVLPAGHGERANPYETPEDISPEWYFVGILQLLKELPDWLGPLIPLVGAMVWVGLPFFLRRVLTSRGSWWLFAAFMSLIVAYALLTIWGYWGIRAHI